MKAITITPDLQIQEVELQEPLHKALQQHVGGWIEVTRPLGLRRPYLMVVNENYLHLQLPFNPLASYLYKTHIHGHPVLGTVVITKEQGEDIVGMDPIEIRLALEALTSLATVMKGESTYGEEET